MKQRQKTDMHQELMDSAYDKLRKDETGLSYSDWIPTLPDIEKFAVLTGNMNYQVCNGGFSQWNMNGYSEFGDELIGFVGGLYNSLEWKEEKDTVYKVLELVTTAVKQISIIEKERESLDSWDDDYEDNKEALENRLGDTLSDLDSKYYDVNSKFLSICNIYLIGLKRTGNQPGQESVKVEIEQKLKNVKPRCKVTGEDGNVFSVLGRVSRALKDAGMKELAEECQQKVFRAGSYDEALGIMGDYVEFC